jgi:hypothetical protein
MDKLVHYTRGGPWHGYLNQGYVPEWMSELRDMLAGSNPRARAEVALLSKDSIAHLSVSYRESDNGKESS